jgi:hypothetical protein
MVHHAYSVTSTAEVIADISCESPADIQIGKPRPLQNDDILNSPLNLLASQQTWEVVKLTFEIGSVLMPLILRLKQSLAEQRAKAMLRNLSSKTTLVITPDTPSEAIEQFLGV